VTHNPVSTVSQCSLMYGWTGWLACGDQRRRTGSGSALDALRDDALYKWPRLLYLLTVAVSATQMLCVHVMTFFIVLLA